MKPPFLQHPPDFLVVAPPEPARDSETKQPRIDDSRAPLFGAHLVAPFGSKAGISPVEVARAPGPWDQNAPHKINNSSRSLGPWATAQATGRTRSDCSTGARTALVGVHMARALRHPLPATVRRRPFLCLRLDRAHPQAHRHQPTRTSGRRRGVVYMEPDPEIVRGA